MFRVTPLAALLIMSATAGQAEKPPYTVPAPKGWGKETIPLPPKGFAPDMTWKGTEEIRFAPGMFKPDAPDFFSYALLFWLPAGQPTDARTIEKELLTYYRGLAKAVLAGKKQDVDAAAFTLALTEMKEKPAKRPGGEAVTVYVGELTWVEPFATGKPQTLRFEVHVWACEKQKHTAVFLCASPRPAAADVWTQLRAIRDATTVP